MIYINEATYSMKIKLMGSMLRFLTIMFALFCVALIERSSR